MRYFHFKGQLSWTLPNVFVLFLQMKKFCDEFAELSSLWNFEGEERTKELGKCLLF